jgi:hypothetical protein
MTSIPQEGKLPNLPSPSPLRQRASDLVPPRKRFIQTHAAEVRNLDI